MPKYSATFDMQTGICLRAAQCCRVLIINKDSRRERYHEKHLEKINRRKGLGNG